MPPSAPEEDIHTVTASQVFGVPPEQVTHEMRRRAKAVNFGIVYGISDFSLSQDIGVTRAEAKAYMEKYFEKYSGVHAYMTQVVERAKADGYVSTLMGRRRWLPELKSSNFNLRSFGERVALNMPIQGTAADLIKKAMLRVDGRLRREGLEARLVLQVHDELIVECPEGGGGAGAAPAGRGDGACGRARRSPHRRGPRGQELGGGQGLTEKGACMDYLGICLLSAAIIVLFSWCAADWCWKGHALDTEGGEPSKYYLAKVRP